MGFSSLLTITTVQGMLRSIPCFFCSLHLFIKEVGLKDKFYFVFQMFVPIFAVVIITKQYETYLF